MPTERPDSPSARRVAIASGVGTTIEFYDFLIYGTAAALVFPKLFFPGLGEAAGTVASFSTFAVAFLARPIGSIVFGHFGDRLGRKRILTLTLLIMGISTVLVGALPTAASIGAAAPILLVLLRVVQGFAIGGEWAGAVLLAAEHAPSERRGFYVIFPQMGAPLAFMLASGTFLITNLTVGDTDAGFLSVGWRVPFLLSIVLVVIGLYVRLRLDETPAFKTAAAATAARTIQQVPILTVLCTQWQTVIIGVGALTGNFSVFYLGTTYLTSYGTNPHTGLGLSRPTVLAMGILAGAVFGIVTIASARLSDRVGRKTMLVWGNVAAVVVGLALFPIMNIGTGWAFALGLAVTMGALGLVWGSAGVLLAELFDTEHRYTGAGLCYNLAAILGGGLAPIAATALAATWGSFSVGLLVAVLCLISFFASRFLPETRGRDLTTTSPASTSAAAQVEA